MDNVRDTLMLHLRRTVPFKVRVFDGSEEYRDVAVPQRRRRWAQVIETIEARPWVRCELLDKAGAALGYVENAVAAGELEDITGHEPPAAANCRWFLELMIKAQTSALTFRDKEHTALLQSIPQILQVLTDAMRETTALMREQRDIVAETAAIKAAAEQGDDLEQVVKLIEASPKLMQTVGPLLMALRAPKVLAAAAKPAAAPAPAKPARPANGASK